MKTKEIAFVVGSLITPLVFIEGKDLLLWTRVVAIPLNLKKISGHLADHRKEICLNACSTIVSVVDIVVS